MPPCCYPLSFEVCSDIILGVDEGSFSNSISVASFLLFDFVSVSSSSNLSNTFSGAVVARLDFVIYSSGDFCFEDFFLGVFFLLSSASTSST